MPPRRSWKFFKVYYFCCVEFVCILFSRIFSMCLPPHRGSAPRTWWGTSVPKTPSLASLSLSKSGYAPDCTVFLRFSNEWQNKLNMLICKNIQDVEHFNKMTINNKFCNTAICAPVQSTSLCIHYALELDCEHAITIKKHLQRITVRKAASCSIL